MGTHRAYTKSGSIEKYEISLWNKPTTPVWVLPSGASKGSVGNPNSNGNYYISMPSQSNYTFTEDSSGPYSVTTYYNGVTNIVKFSRAENKETIIFKLDDIAENSIVVIVYPLNPSGVKPDVNVTCTISKISGNSDGTNSFTVVVHRQTYQTYTTPSTLGIKVVTGDVYSITSVSPMSSSNYNFKYYFLGIRVK